MTGRESIVQLGQTNEQRMLGDAVNSLLDRNYDAVTRLRLLEHDPQGWSTAMWKRYADLGLLGLPFDEQYGGAGMGADELAVVMEAFGRALALEPYFATVVLGAQLVAAAGTPEQKQEILPSVAAGDILLAFAFSEPESRWSLTDISTTATQRGDAWTLTGRKSAVLGGDVADHVIVTATIPDGTVGLFLVTGSDLTKNTYRMQDGLGGADLLLNGTPARLLGNPAEALTHVGTVLDKAAAALCAEAVGIMEKMLWLSVDYLKIREQFGHPIARFQALQFRAADMYVSYEQAKSMAILARLALSVDNPVERRRAMSAAKAQVNISAQHVGQQAVQLHGGTGITTEYPVGHYFKRATVITKTFADQDTLLELVGAGDGLVRS